MNADLTDTLKTISQLSNDSFRSGYKEGYEAGYRAGLKAAELIIAGKSPEEARAESHRNLP